MGPAARPAPPTERELDMKHKIAAALAALTALSALQCAEPQPGHTVSVGVAKSSDTDPRKAHWDDAKPAVEIATTQPAAGAVRMPAEAAPWRKRRVRVEFMNSSQVAAYLKAGGDMAVLPIGAVAAPGPDLPAGAPTFNVHATAVLLAERWHALAFPPIPYAFAGPTSDLPGTVSISHDAALAYTRKVIESLLDGGFKRVVVLCGRAHSRQVLSLTRTIYRDRRQLVIPCWANLLPDSNEVVEALGFRPADDIRTLASLRILGHPGVFEPGAGPSPGGSASGAAELRSRMGKAGLTAPALAASVHEGLAVRTSIKPADVDKAIRIMRRQARKYDAMPAVYARYLRQMADLEAFAPWSLQRWDKAVAACRYDAIPEHDETAFSPGMDKDAADVYVPSPQFPDEAQPDYQRKHRAEFMTAREMAERMKDDPVAILPCGAFEMHGPHGLLGTDTFEAHGNAVVTAKRWNAIVFPPIAYTYAGATERYPGTVSVSHYEVADYVKAVASSLLKAGFRRVCIMWVHAPGRSTEELVVQDLLHEEGKVVFTCHPWLLRGLVEKLGYGGGEDIWTLSGLKILGHPGVFVVDEPEDVGVRKLPFHTMVEFSAMSSSTAWYMGLPTHHLRVRRCVKSGDEDKVIPIMRESAKHYDEAPKLMSEYLQHVRQAADGRRAQ